MPIIEHPADRNACHDALEASGYEWEMNYSVTGPYVQVGTVRVYGFPTLTNCLKAIEKAHSKASMSTNTSLDAYSPVYMPIPPV